jgi:hypothetical protein
VRCNIEEVQDHAEGPMKFLQRVLDLGIQVKREEFGGYA